MPAQISNRIKQTWNASNCLKIKRENYGYTATEFKTYSRDKGAVGRIGL